MNSFVSYLFLKHPHSKGMTYLSHMGHALKNAIMLSIAVLILCIHSIIPCLFEHTGSDIVEKVCENLKGNIHNIHNIYDNTKIISSPVSSPRRHRQ